MPGLLAALRLPHLLTHVRPRHVDDRHPEEAVAVVLQTRERIVPRHERRKHAERAAGDLEVAAGRRVAHAVGVVLAREEEEGQVQGEEEREEGHGRLEGAQEQDGGEDEPAGQEEADRGLDVVRVGGIWPRFGQDLPGLGCLEEGVGDPEAAVGGEGGGTEGVADGHFPIVRLSQSLPFDCSVYEIWRCPRPSPFQ